MDAPTAPCVVLLESNAANNDDWVTDHDDPDNITWTNYTEGTEALVIYNISQFQVQFVTGVSVKPIGSGISAEALVSTRQYAVLLTGTVNGITQANYVDYFSMIDAHTKAASKVPYYLFYKLDTNVYKNFVDKNSASKQYARAWITKGSISFNSSQPQQWIVQMELMITWR